MAHFTQDAAEWFCRHLQNSDNAEVKHRYLHLHATSRNICYTPSDPLFVSGLHWSSWTLRELLWRTRYISLDERTLWECLGPCMIAEDMTRMVDPWNEQLAVKLTFYFLEEHKRRPYAEGPDFIAMWNHLRGELDTYVTSTIKPQGTLTVTDCMAQNALVINSSTIATAAAANDMTDGWSDKVTFVPMEVGNDYSEGSLRCTAPVPSFGTLLQVPRTEMFYRDSIVQHCVLGRAIAAAPSLREILENEEAMLVLCLVYEKFVAGVAKSHWRRLLAQCPPSYPTIPSMWPLCDLSELDGLDMLDDVLAKRTQLQTFADQLQESLLALLHAALTDAGHDTDETASEATSAASPPVGTGALPSLEAMAEAFSWENLVWAQSTFDSRAFNLNVDGSVVVALVPLADMINHANRTDVLIRKVEPNDGPFTMQVGAALTSADIGRELWMSYGPLQNWELLQHYGFVLGCDNVHDQLPFPLDLSAIPVEDEDETPANTTLEDRWNRRRGVLLRRYALALAGRCWIRHDGVPPPVLLALLRLQLAEANEFEAMEDNLYGPFRVLSAETEVAVVAAVAQTVQCVLDVFPTTLEEDEETLQLLRQPRSTDRPESSQDEEEDSDSTYNHIMCLQLRIGLKRIARRALEWCEVRRVGKL